MNTSKADLLVKSLAVVAVLFGLLTVFSGGRTLFGGEGARLAAGAIVPFVLWFNFVAGFATFGVHAWNGGAYEARTVGAMALRTLLWTGIAGTAYRACRHFI